MENDKLIGTLRVNLESLKNDVSQANNILENLSKIKIDSIDEESGKKAIEVIRSIEQEFDNLKKANGEGFDTKILNSLEKTIIDLGVNIGTVTTKVTEFFKSGAEEAQKTAQAYKTVTEAVDEYNRKTKETTYAPQKNEKTGEIIQKSPSTTITNDYAAQTKQQEQLEEASAKATEQIYKENDALDAYKAKMQSNVDKLFSNDILPKDQLSDFENALNKLDLGSTKSDFQSIENSYKNLVDEQKQLNLEKQNELNLRKEAITDVLKETEQEQKFSEQVDKGLDSLDAYTSKMQININKLFSNDILPKDQLTSFEEELGKLNLGSTKLDFQSIENSYKNLIDEQGQLNKSINDELNLHKQSISDLLKEVDSNQKIADQIEKQNQLSLKQYTQEQANLSEYNKMSEQLAKISGEQNLSMSSSSSSNSMMDRFKLSGSYLASATIIYQIQNALSSAIKTNEDYETSLTDLGRVLGNVSDKDLKNFGQSAIQLSKDFGEPLQQVQDAMNSLASAGVQDKASLESMTKTVMMGVNTSDIKDASTMTDLLTSSMKQLNISYSQSEQVLDSWNKMADVSLAKTSDYAEAVSKAGMTSKAMGIDLNQLNGIVSVLADNTGKSGDEIGDALKSVETRLERPNTLKTLQQYGIEVMKDKDHFKDFGDIMTQVSSALDKYGENTTQSNAIEDALGGTMRKDWIDILAQNYGQVNAMAEQSANSVGYSASKSEKTMQTLGKQVEVLKTTVSEFFISLGEDGGLGQLKDIIGAGKDIIEILNDMPSGAQRLLILIPEVSLAVKGLSTAFHIFKGEGIRQFLDSLNLPEKNIGGILDFGGQTTTVKAYNAAVNSLTNDIKNGNITEEESATILGVVGEKLNMAKSSTNVLAAAEQALNDKVEAGKITEEAAAVAMDKLKEKTGANATTTEAAAASEDALAASQKMTLASTLALNVAMGAIIIAASSVITTLMSLHKSTQDVESDIDSLATKMSSNQQNDALIKKYQDLEKQLKSTSKSSQDYTDIQTQITQVQEQLAEQFPTLVTGYDDEGKAIATNVKALKEYNDEKKNQIAASNASDYSKLYKELNTKDGSSAFQGLIPSILGNKVDTSMSTEIEQYTENMKKLQQELKTTGQDTEGYGDKTKATQDKIDALNKATMNMWSAGYRGSQQQYFDTSSLQWETYTQYMKKNSDETKKNSDAKDSNSKSLKNNSNSFSENTDETQDNTTALQNAQSQEEQYQKTIESSTNKVKDYSKYIKDMNDNTGHMPSKDVAEIANKYPELLAYMGDEKTLYNQINSSINTNKQTAQTAYAQMIIAHEQAKQAIAQEAQQYQQLAASQSQDTASKKQMSQIAQDLANNIDGVITATDSEGNVTVTNMDLVNKQVGMLQTEGTAYQGLANVKLSTSKESAEIDTGNTQTTYENAKTRIASIMAEVQALEIKEQAEIKAASVVAKASNGKVTGMGGGTDFDKTTSQINADNDDVQKIKDAMSAIDKLYDTAGKATSAVIDNMDGASEGTDSTAKAEAAQRAAEEAQKKQQDALKKSLEDQKKEADASLDASYKIQKQHDDDINNSLQTQIDQLERKKQLTSDENELLKDQNALTKAQSELDYTQNQDDTRMLTATGFQWVADPDAVKSAQQKVQDAQDAVNQKQSDMAYTQQENSLNDQKTAAENKANQDEQNYQNQKSTTDAGYDDKINAITGYKTGVDSVPQDGIYTLAEGDVPELVTKEQKVKLPQGAGVYNGSETSQILGGTTKTTQAVVNNSNSSVVQSTKKVLSAVDDVIQDFVDNSTSYPKDTDKNVAKSITDNKDLVNKPLLSLISGLKSSIEDFVNNSPEYSKNTNKNIGSTITSTSNLVIDPTKALLSNLNTTFTTFVSSTTQYGLSITKDIGQGMQDGTKDLEKIINDLCTKIIDDFHTDLGIHSPSTIAKEIGSFWMQGLINGMTESDIESLIATKMGSVVNSTQVSLGGNIASYLQQAMKDTGTPDSWLEGLEMIASRESGNPGQLGTGNANLKNNVSVDGEYATGLMQMLPSTFEEYMKNGHNNILNPVDNAESAIDYIKSRYGSVYNIPNWNSSSYRGYEDGSYGTLAGWAAVNEKGQEMRLMNDGDGVVTAQRTRSISEFADKIPDLMSRFEVPNFNAPSIEIKVPNSSGGDTHLNLGNISLPNVKSGSQLVTQLQQIVKTHNY
jgi:TP901 family phage tail tape measure protein